MWCFMTLLIYIFVLAFMIGYYHYTLKSYIVFFIGFLSMQILVFIVDLFFTNSLKDFLFAISLLFPVVITISFWGILLYQAFFKHETIKFNLILLILLLVGISISTSQSFELFILPFYLLPVSLMVCYNHGQKRYITFLAGVLTMQCLLIAMSHSFTLSISYENKTLTEELCNKYNLDCDRW